MGAFDLPASAGKTAPSAARKASSRLSVSRNSPSDALPTATKLAVRPRFQSWLGAVARNVPPQTSSIVTPATSPRHMGSDPLKVFFDLASREPEDDGPPVRTDA